MNLRETLLARKPTVRPFQIGDQTYYIRELNVGETNEILYGQRSRLIKLAEKQGIKLNYEDEEALQIQLSNIYDPQSLVRTIAFRLCDENGQNLFDPENEDDLNAIAKLDSSVLDAFSKAVVDGEPKNSANAEDSK